MYDNLHSLVVVGTCYVKKIAVKYMYDNSPLTIMVLPYMEHSWEKQLIVYILVCLLASNALS